MNKILFLALIILSANTIAQQQVVKVSTYKKVEYPNGYSARLNVIYTTLNHWQGKMDMYLPPRVKRPSPIVINIHGGGWNHGVKESQTGFNAFFKKGFAVVNVEYRLTGQATAPAAVQDIRCALIYVIKNAKALHIDVNKIVMMGSSSGAHLALMGGLLGNNHIFDANCPGVDTIKVAAIIDKYGITDVWDWAYGPNLTSKSASRWLGDKANDKKFAASVSPVTYISKHSPPVFIVHGDADHIVPYRESVDLYKKLLASGLETQFVTVKGGLQMYHQINKRTYGLVRANNGGRTSFPYVIYNDHYNHKDFITALINSGFAGVLWTPEVRASKRWGGDHRHSRTLA